MVNMWDCTAYSFKSWKMMSNKILGWEVVPRYCQARLSIWQLRKLVSRNMESCIESFSNSESEPGWGLHILHHLLISPCHAISYSFGRFEQSETYFLTSVLFGHYSPKRVWLTTIVFSKSKNFSCENQKRLSLSLDPTLYNMEKMLSHMHMQDLAWMLCDGDHHCLGERALWKI